MGGYLKQSTSATINIGPILSFSDGSNVTDSSLLNIRIKKNDSAYESRNSSGTIVHVGSGTFDIPLDSTDFNTCGRLKLLATASGAIPWTETFDVKNSTTWDLEYGDEAARIDALMVNEAIRQGYLPGDNAVIVKYGATDLDRGLNYKTAYTAAKLLTPGGQAISVTNRATVLLPKWHYRVSTLTEEGEATCTTLNANYVDIVALFPERAQRAKHSDIDYRDGTTSLSQFRPGGTVIYSDNSNPELQLTTMVQSVADVRLIGFAVANLSNVLGSRNFYVSADTNDASYYKWFYTWNRYPYGTDNAGIVFKRHVAGTWIECDSNCNAWRIGTLTGVQSRFSATMIDCIGGFSSFIGDTGSNDETSHIASGCYLIGCETIGKQASNSSSTVYEGHGFAGCTSNGVHIDDTCTFIRCKSQDRSFGLGMRNRGRHYYCEGGIDSFGGTTDTAAGWYGNFAGFAYKCIAKGGSFGGNSAGETAGKCTGTIVDCIIEGSDEPHHLEGATIINTTITMNTTDKNVVTILDSNSIIHNSILLPVEGGSGIPIYAASGLNVSAAGNTYGNKAVAANGLGTYVTNTATSDEIKASNDIPTAEEIALARLTLDYANIPSGTVIPKYSQYSSEMSQLRSLVYNDTSRLIQNPDGSTHATQVIVTNEQNQITSVGEIS